jgi:hypothetical protein
MEIGRMPCGREVRLGLGNARRSGISGVEVLDVHWRRALVGALRSLAAGMMVVRGQKEDVCASVPRHLQSEAPPCGVDAPVCEALGPDAVLSVRALAALGLPLVLVVPLGWDGRSEPPDGVPGLFAASLFPSRRARARVV